LKIWNSKKNLKKKTFWTKNPEHKIKNVFRIKIFEIKKCVMEIEIWNISK